ncbi:MAG TPA: GNA1162 family protein [Candidatus Binataceae bacterium]|nr:GNA1162 family protein [Candidatus Binataceae bacterium]
MVGKSPEVQADSVRSIKTIRLRRIAVMPPIEAPAPGSTVAEGATDSLTAELQAKMALEAGWQLIPESDVVDAMQKLPPTNAADLQQNAIELGRKTGADGVLYGEIETYKERVGSDYAAASPAAVAFTLHLVDLKSGQVIWNARFHKSQKALNENLFDVVAFVQNSGRWVRAHEIAQQGVDQAVENLHSKLNLQQEGPSFPIPEYEGKYDNPQ